MRKNWSQWIGYLTAAVSLAYGALGLYWASGSGDYPFGVGDPDLVNEGDDAIVANLLGFSTPAVAGPWIAAVGLLGAIAALLMARGVGRGAVRGVLIGLGALLAVGLTVIVQDYRPLTLIAYLPIVGFGRLLFGWPPEVRFVDLFPWSNVNQVILLLIGIAFALTVVAYRRRSSGSCASCGRTETATTARLVAWGKPAVIVAIVTPLIYCATRWIWALGINIGMPEKMFREMYESGLLYAGAALATMGAGGALLTLGLIQKWGEVFPRWMIGLRGRRVPVRLAVIPATLVAILVTAAGGMYIRGAFANGTDGQWVTGMPETLWPIWGAALFIAAMAYHQRRRRACGTCERV